MNKFRWLPLLLFTVAVLALLVYYPSAASDENQAALVVDFGNGQIATRCVGFSEATISGFDLLERSGLPVETDFQSGGAAVCRIDGQGCPSDDCFCSCRGGGDCLYWAYWHQLDGAWSYSAAGSALYQVADGAVEGWVWGLGSVTQATPPPPVAFSDVCAAAAETPTATATPSRTATPIVLPTLAPTGDNLLGATPTRTVGPTSPPATSGASTATVTTGTVTTATVATAGSATATARPTLLAAPALAGLPSPTTTAGQPADQLNLAAPTAVAPAVVAANDAGGATATLVSDPPTAVAPSRAPSGLDFVEPAAGQPPAPVVEFATPTPALAVVAVVGAQSAGIASSPANPAATKSGGPDVLAYAGFVGLVLLLLALALVLYRRRGETGHGEHL